MLTAFSRMVKLIYSDNKFMIYFNNVSKAYEKSLVLDNINLVINPGEFVAITGHSGAGKTTLIKLIVAEEKPTDGSVYFESTEVGRLSQGDITKLRKRVGVAFQDYRLLPNKTAYENIAFAMEAAGKTDEEIEADIPYVLGLVDLDDRMGHFPGELSGGERQRLAIARAIINEPELLIADEPTGNLDDAATEEVVQILKKIHDLGTTVLLTTHNKSVVNSIKPRVITLEKGRIIHDDKHSQRIV